MRISSQELTYLLDYVPTWYPLLVEVQAFLKKTLAELKSRTEKEEKEMIVKKVRDGNAIYCFSLMY
jgi:hypothetical protein